MYARYVYIDLMAYNRKGTEKSEDNIHDIDYMVFYSTHAHVQQNLMYLSSFVFSLRDDGYVEAKTCRRDIVNDK